MARGGKRLVDVAQKRKSEAPFYRQLHQWLVQARHKAACVEHEDALLVLQEAFLANKISQGEMQKEVRKIVAGNFDDGRAAAAERHGAAAAAAAPPFWHHSISRCGEWEALSGADGPLCEILLRRQFKTSSRLEPTFRYCIECASAWAASTLLFSLLRRFSHEEGGLASDKPVLAWDHLRKVRLTYGPADRDVLGRWEDVQDRVARAQCNSYERLRTAVIALQNLQRFGSLSPLAEKVGEAETTKRKKKRKKKKAPTPTLDSSNQANSCEPGSEPGNQTSGSPQQTSSEGSRAAVGGGSAGPTASKAAPANLENSADQAATDSPREPLQLAQQGGPRAKAGGPAQAELSGRTASPGLVLERLNLLGAEIHELVAYLDSTMAKMSKARNQLIWRVQGAVHAAFPCAKVHLFGSHACGFALPSSDVDLYYVHQPGACIEPTMPPLSHSGAPAPCRMHGQPVSVQLEYIQNALRGETWVKRVDVVKNAAMPVVRIATCLMALQGEAEDTHLSDRDHLCPMCCMVDLSCGHSAGHSHMLLSDFLQRKCTEFPQLRPLMLVVKQLLVERKLCDVFRGGISSFSLSLLILRYLQHMRQFPLEASVTRGAHDSASMFEPGPGRLVDVSKDAVAQAHLALAYKRASMRWPRTERSSPPAYVTSSGPAQLGSEHVLRESAAAKSRPAEQSDRPPSTEKHSEVAETSAPPAESADDVVFAAYHRQLADWPSSDAAHHFAWMKTMAAASLLSPRGGSGEHHSLFGDISRAHHRRLDDSAPSSPALRPHGAPQGTAEAAAVVAAAARGADAFAKQQANMPKDDIGETLLGLLDFYGNQFNSSSVGVTVIGEGAFYLLSRSTFSRPPQPLTIDNPLWPNLNVAAPSFAIHHVLAAMSEIHAVLDAALHAPERVEAARGTVLRKVIKLKWGARSKILLARALQGGAEAGPG